MEMWQYEFMRRAMAAGLMVAWLCPLVGMLVVVRRQSLLGDGLGHIAFAGVTASAWWGIYPPLGAMAVTLLAALGIERVRRRHRHYSDMGLALFFYAGLASAIVFASLANVSSAGIMSFLFGSILTVTSTELIGMAAVTAVVTGLLWICRRELVALAFDEAVARVNGVRVDLLQTMFALLIAGVVVLGMTVVGILLVSALMIVPVAAAHLWRQNFARTTGIALGYSLLAVVGGLVLSYQYDLAPGGTIVLTGLAAYVLTGWCTALRRRAGHGAAPMTDGRKTDADSDDSDGSCGGR